MYKNQPTFFVKICQKKQPPIFCLFHGSLCLNICALALQVFFWSVFSCIWTRKNSVFGHSMYLVRIQENTNQKKLHIWTLFVFSPNTERYGPEKTPYSDNFSPSVNCNCETWIDRTYRKDEEQPRFYFSKFLYWIKFSQWVSRWLI